MGIQWLAKQKYKGSQSGKSRVEDHADQALARSRSRCAGRQYDQRLLGHPLGSQLPRQFRYGQTQSRIGKPLQQTSNLDIENSPIFHITKVKTPRLIIANDADDALPCYQGIKLFLALCRNQKEAHLFDLETAKYTACDDAPTRPIFRYVPSSTLIIS